MTVRKTLRVSEATFKRLASGTVPPPPDPEKVLARMRRAQSAGVRIGIEGKVFSDEASLQAHAERELFANGWLFFHDTDARKNRSGLPDLVAVHPQSHVVLFWELKGLTGTLEKGRVVGSGRNIRWAAGQDEWGAALFMTAASTSYVHYGVFGPGDESLIEQLARALAVPGGHAKSFMYMEMLARRKARRAESAAAAPKRPSRTKVPAGPRKAATGR